MTDPDLDYLRDRILAGTFEPYPWDGEDRNIGAFRSREECAAWFCQPPGEDGRPYRDRGFYCRELAMLSRAVRPRLVVELGTSLGIGTFLLHRLNPGAELVTVDCRLETFMPGDRRVPVGHLARWNRVACEYVWMNSWEYGRRGVGLCFIDADHSYGPVLLDSRRAWENRAAGEPWAIAWHDHNARHPGVLRAVAEFCKWSGAELQSRPDSDTVWVWGGVQ